MGDEADREAQAYSVPDDDVSQMVMEENMIVYGAKVALLLDMLYVMSAFEIITSDVAKKFGAFANSVPQSIGQSGRQL